MEFAKVVVLRGSNHWATEPVVEVLVDFRAWREQRTDHLPAFRERLSQWLKTLASQFQPTGLANSARLTVADGSRKLADLLQQGTTAAVVFQHVGQLLQAVLGVDALFGETVETDEPDVFRIALQYEEESVARACLETARRMCVAAHREEAFDLTAEVRLLVDLADDARLGPSSRAIVNAAMARGIPFRRLNTGSLVQYGEGKFLRRTWTAETDVTSAIGESIASDKALTKRLLLGAGVPVPLGRPVSDAEDAWVAAGEIGFPVVVKPRDANHARGVSLNLTTREQVVAAYDWARRDGETEDVMVEQFARGQHHRLLVIGNQLIAAARGDSEFVVGDGQKNIAQLVAEVNQDPRRGENYTDLLQVLKLDDAALIQLQRQGFTPDSVPPKKKRVLIQYVGDLTNDCTDDVHPEVAARAVLAARVVGLDVAGMDCIAVDISRPLEEQRGMILEVNAGPSLGMHVAPLNGKPRPVGEAIINTMFAAGQNGRLPIVAVCGSGKRSAVAQEIDSLLRAVGRQTGMANSEGLYFAGQRYSTQVRCDRDNLCALLSHPYVDTVIFESRPTQAASEGIGYQRLDVVVVPELTKADREPQGEKNQSPEWLGTIAALRAVSAAGTAILPANVNDLDVLLRLCRGKTVIFDLHEDSPQLQRCVSLGKPIAFIRGDQIVRKLGRQETVIGMLDKIGDDQHAVLKLVAHLAAEEVQSTKYGVLI